MLPVRHFLLNLWTAAVSTSPERQVHSRSAAIVEKSAPRARKHLYWSQEGINAWIVRLRGYSYANGGISQRYCLPEGLARLVYADSQESLVGRLWNTRAFDSSRALRLGHFLESDARCPEAEEPTATAWFPVTATDDRHARLEGNVETKRRDFLRIIFHSHNRSSHLGARDIALADSDESTVPGSILKSSDNASVPLSTAFHD